MRRILAAAVVGGVVVFTWGAVAHMVTPLGMAGMKLLPREDATIQALHGSIPQNGLYIFPAQGVTSKDEAVQKAWLEKYRRGPTGMLVYQATGSEPMTGRMLGVELFSDLVAALIAALLVSWMAVTYPVRVAAVFLLALFEFFSLSLGYWNWYGFPPAYIGAELVTEAVGWLLAGLVIARLVPGRLHGVGARPAAAPVAVAAIG